MNQIQEKRTEVEEICRQHHLDQLFVFGSVVRHDFNPGKSDLDFLVTFLPFSVEDYFDNFLSLVEKLESLFGIDVDVVECEAIRNPILKRVVDREKQLFYDRAAA